MGQFRDVTEPISPLVMIVTVMEVDQARTAALRRLSIEEAAITLEQFHWEALSPSSGFVRSSFSDERIG